MIYVGRYIYYENLKPEYFSRLLFEDIGNQFYFKNISIFCCKYCNYFGLRSNFMLDSLISIVGVVVSEKYNYHEWSRKIKHTLIFNDLWKGVSEGEGGNPPVKPTSGKELFMIKETLRIPIPRSLSFLQFITEILNYLQ